ncbi:MAG: class I SAM-dependent methyltransferase [Patescibacteria group bacterium]|nr:class I SAM-dependent methyltransferase [Patescibacteria group bacterium]
MLNNLYQEVKDAFLSEQTGFIPKEYQSKFVNIGRAYESIYIIQRLFRIARIKKGKILVIGASGGAEYFSLKIDQHQVFAFDLVKIKGVKNLKIGNVEESLPYPEKEFDAVVICEVLEHLNLDSLALQNIRRILKKNGFLIGSVPFFHDSFYHMRVYSPKTIVYLLENNGYVIKKVIERPGLFRLPFWFNRLIHLAGWISLKLFGFTIHTYFLPFWSELEFKLGQKKNFWRRFSSIYGVYFLAQKNKIKKQYLKINAREYGEN